MPPHASLGLEQARSDMEASEANLREAETMYTTAEGLRTLARHKHAEATERLRQLESEPE